MTEQFECGVIASLGGLGWELQTPAVTAEGKAPVLVEAEERVWCDDQRSEKIQIRVRMQIEQISAEEKDDGVRASFAQFVNQKNAVLHVGREEADVTDRIAMNRGKNLFEHLFDRRRFEL